MSGKDTTQQAAGVAKSAPAMNNIARMASGANTGAEQYLAPLALWGGIGNFDSGLERMGDGDAVDGALQATQGVGGITAGTVGTANLLGAGVTAGALPVAAAVGAGAATGIGVANRGNNYIADTGLLGQNDDGSGKDWSDWAGDGAWEDREAWTDLTGNETIGAAAGYASLAGRSVAGAAGAAVTGVAGLATDAWSLATSW